LEDGEDERVRGKSSVVVRIRGSGSDILLSLQFFIVVALDDGGFGRLCDYYFLQHLLQQLLQHLLLDIPAF
jgi:hypothetical protein